MPKKKKSPPIFICRVINNAYFIFHDGSEIGHIFITAHPDFTYEAYTPKSKSKRITTTKEGIIWLYKQFSGHQLKKPIALTETGAPFL